MKIAGSVLALALVAGCASTSPDVAAHTPTPSPSTYSCSTRVRDSVRADLLGNRHLVRVDLLPASGARCTAYLMPQISGTAAPVVLDDLPLAPDGLRAVTLPDRRGQVVLLVQTNPRGGYQAHLFGYADKKFDELTVEGHPIFPFVATDTGASHLGAHCEGGGFDVETAVHSAAGWKIERAVYQVQGNSVSVGVNSVVAEGVSDLDFQQRFGDLAGDELFTACG